MFKKIICFQSLICVTQHTLYILSANNILQDHLEVEKLSSAKLKEKMKGTDGEEERNEDGNGDQTVETSGEVVETEMVQRGPESTIHTALEHFSNMVNILSSIRSLNPSHSFELYVLSVDLLIILVLNFEDLMYMHWISLYFTQKPDVISSLDFTLVVN